LFNKQGKEYFEIKLENDKPLFDKDESNKAVAEGLKKHLLD
jgi:hypothetical protein